MHNPVYMHTAPPNAIVQLHASHASLAPSHTRMHQLTHAYTKNLLELQVTSETPSENGLTYETPSANGRPSAEDHLQQDSPGAFDLLMLPIMHKYRICIPFFVLVRWGRKRSSCPFGLFNWSQKTDASETCPYPTS